MGLLNKKVKASTLIESIVSMLIILMVFGTFAITFASIIDSDGGEQELKAMSIVNKAVSEAEAIKVYTDSTMKEDGFSVVRSVSPCSNNPNAMIMCIKAINTKGKVVSKSSKILNK